LDQSRLLGRKGLFAETWFVEAFASIFYKHSICYFAAYKLSCNRKKQMLPKIKGRSKHFAQQRLSD